jgi:GNAT superfamily N-acetyltransferase
MIEAVTSERSLSAAKALIRDHFEAHSEAHDASQIAAVIDSLPSPYVPPAGGLWVAWEGEEATGCVALQPLSDEVGEVKRMYVKPEHRGKGIARALAAVVIDEARARGYSRLRLGTLASMLPAQNLYLSLGFVPIEPYRNIEFGTTLFYELNLGQAE